MPVGKCLALGRCLVNVEKVFGAFAVLIAQTKAGKSHRSALQKGWGGGGAFYLLDLDP